MKVLVIFGLLMERRGEGTPTLDRQQNPFPKTLMKVGRGLNDPDELKKSR